jgi:hypothetical protein
MVINSEMHLHGKKIKKIKKITKYLEPKRYQIWIKYLKGFY